MNWTPERVEELLALWRQGLTSYQIAAHFGVTRNTVIGKLDRVRVALGLLPKRQSDLTRTERRRRNKMLSLASRAESVSAYVSSRPSVPDQGQLASIIDVTGCRWPVKDDPSFVGGVAFCNHDQKEGSSYCAYHARKAVMPYKPKPIEGTLGPLGLRFPRRAA
jgi:GcrA cell cycle regulator